MEPQDDNAAMRREVFFQPQGAYGQLVATNVLLHREAAVHGATMLSGLFKDHPDIIPVRVLDLACGGMPSSAASMLAPITDHVFEYQGVDLNPSQVAAARDFSFPGNVIDVQIKEGSAWDLAHLGDEHFDVVYLGLNLHHGSLQECFFLFRQLYDLIRPGGLFINHDWFRPDDEPYLHRPAVDPEQPEVDLRLVDPSRLATLPPLPIDVPEASADDLMPDWKRAGIDLLVGTFLKRGGQADGAAVIRAHQRQRDYPISFAEARALLEAVGFQVSRRRYDAPHEPLHQMLTMLVAQKP